jgi:hypothetical protein
MNLCSCYPRRTAQQGQIIGCFTRRILPLLLSTRHRQSNRDAHARAISKNPSPPKPYGLGGGVGRGLGVGADLGVGDGLAVDVGVGEAVPVAVAVGVGVGVPPTCTSNEPMSIPLPLTRSNPGPRWSKKGGGTKLGSPASMAGLPGKRACVKVGPPLSCSGPSIGSVLI